MRKFAVSFERVETRIVWAEDEDDAIEVALNIEPPEGRVIEDTLNVSADEADPGDRALNTARGPSPYEIVKGEAAGPFDGVRRDRDGTGMSYAWKVFPRATTNEEALAALDWPSAYYYGAGRGFSHGPSLTRKGSRLLVVYPEGLDI